MLCTACAARKTQYCIAVLKNHAVGAVRDMRFCSDMGGKLRCRKGMYRPARGVKTFLNKGNECGHVFGIFSGE